MIIIKAVESSVVIVQTVVVIVRTVKCSVVIIKTIVVIVKAILIMYCHQVHQ